MNSSKNQLESQKYGKEPKSILSVRNLVIVGAILLLVIGAGSFVYMKSTKSTDITDGGAKVITPKNETYNYETNSRRVGSKLCEASKKKILLWLPR